MKWIDTTLIYPCSLTTVPTTKSLPHTARIASYCPPAAVLVRATILGVAAVVWLSGCGDSQPTVPAEETVSSVAAAPSQRPAVTDPVDVNSAVVASWDNQIIAYGQVRNVVQRELAGALAFAAGNPDYTSHIVDQMKKRIDEIVQRALMVAEAEERGVTIGGEAIDAALRSLKASARDEATFSAMVRGATGPVLRDMLRNQLLTQAVQELIKNEISSSITEERKRSFYEENLGVYFTKQAATVGRRFLVQSCSEPPGDLRDPLIRLVRYHVNRLGDDVTPTGAQEAVRALDDSAFTSLLLPSPDLWTERIVATLRDTAVRLAPIAAAKDEMGLSDVLDASMPDILACFAGRSPAQANARAEAFRAQAAELIADATDVDSKDARFKLFVRDHSEDELVRTNLAYCHIYHRMGPDGPAKSFGNEFMETVRVAPVGGLSPVVDTPAGYGFMLVKKQQPEQIAPYDARHVQLHIPHLIHEKAFKDWLDNLYERHHVTIDHEFLSALAERDFGGGAATASSQTLQEEAPS